jgi:hypothetical protein
MKQTESRLRIYFATGVIGAKCERCGWGAKTSYVPGETAHQTANRVFGGHVCPQSANKTEATVAITSPHNSDHHLPPVAPKL